MPEDSETDALYCIFCEAHLEPKPLTCNTILCEYKYLRPLL